MKVIYPLKEQEDYTELMYSLRSIDKFLPGDNEIIIVGGQIPVWLTGVTWVGLNDVKHKKQLSIKRKIIAGLEYTGEPSLVINDDSFLLREQTEFPFYYEGDLMKYSESGSVPLRKQLQGYGCDIKNFDIHYPIIYGTDFKDICSLFPADCIIKSMYCNYKHIEGIEKRDCKLKHSVKPDQIRLFIRELPSFNVGALSFKSAIPVLQELFPKKCRYEIK